MTRTARRCFIAGLTLALTVSRCAFALGPEEVASWRADLDVYEETLEANHIDLFNTVSRKTFSRELAALRDELDKMDEEEIVVALMALTRKIGDGHSAIPLWGTPYKRFPFEVTIVGDEVVLTGTSAEHASLLGARLVSINNAPSAKVIASVSKIAPFVENGQSMVVRTGMYMLVSELLTGLGFTEDDGEAMLEFEKDGRRLSIATAPIDKAAFADAIISRLDYRKGYATEPFFKVNDEFWASSANDGETIYIRFDAYPSEAEIDEMGMALLGYIGEHASKNLIIDLRENFGGDLYLGLKLAAYLNTADSIDWKNGVYALIGAKTFSAAMSNSAQYRQLLNARLIGEPTGGRPCGYQDMGQFNLPNSGLLVTYSKRRFCIEEGEAVIPDIVVPMTKADYIALHDAALEQALADIASRK